MIKFLVGLVIGVIAGCFIGNYNYKLSMPTTLDTCNNELLVCQSILKDPHHCISVVVETLEGIDGCNNK